MNDQSKRSVHGGKDSHLCIEVSAVRFMDDGSVETCNHQLPEHAQAFGIYIRNPLAFHVQDFGPETTDPEKRVSIREAASAAFNYADALADHLGCEVVSAVPRPVDPLADLLPGIRARLVDEMGFGPEMVGGGCYILSSYGAKGGSVWVTGSDGSGMPTGVDFMVCAYPPPLSDTHSPEPFLTLSMEAPPAAGQESRALGLYEAVQAALSALAEREGH